MPSVECTNKSEPVGSILFAHAADEELKSLVLSCLQGCRELHTAKSGGETLKLYRTKLPCIVVAALELGDMTGFELCRRIRAVLPEAQVVLVGRERGESVYRRAMEAGAVSYILMDENAADSLKVALVGRSALCEARSAQQLTTASYRRQADSLQALPLSVAMLSAGKLLSANRAFENMVGFTCDNHSVALSAALAGISSAESAGCWSALLEASAKNVEWSGTVTCSGRNGIRVYIRAVLSLIQAEQNGSYRYQLLVLDDITAHEELRAHLSVQRDSAFEIIESIHGASEIEEVKSLARLLAAESLPAAHPFSLRTLVATVMASVSERFSDRGREVHSTVPPYLSDLFLGTQNAICRALSCLLGNSLENCEGGDVNLKVDLKGKDGSGTRIQFAVAFSSSRVAVNRFESMQDYLTGLNLVEESQRPRRTGLSLAAALIEKMGGTTWVKSMMNQGRTYCFSLSVPESPAADTAVSNDAQVSEAAPELYTAIRPGFNGVLGTKSVARPRILLADDNEVDQLTICRLLESMDYEVIRVSNGREAVEEFDTSSCDAVLMDILMPEMDGFEATRMIREKERLAGGGHTPIIALTSYSLKAIHEKCVSVGMDSYLHKPVSARDITKLFSSVLSVESAPDSVPHEQETELPLIDVQDTLDNLDNNIDLYREIMDLFATNIPFAHQDFVTAIRTCAVTDVLQNAHKIKGMSSSVGAKRYAELARMIEDSALNGTIGDPAQWLNRLSTEFLQLMDAIVAINWHEFLLEPAAIIQSPQS